MDEEKYFALVTGASSGIGLALARELARRGYPLLLVSNEEKRIAETAVEVGNEFNVRAVSLYIDLSQSDSAQKIFNYCAENNIKIEILVNNAGIFFFRDIIKTKPPLVETAINLHVLTPSLLCRLFAEQMADSEENRSLPGPGDVPPRKGYIVNMASIAAHMMMPGIVLYSATKSYLRCFSLAIRHELYPKNIFVTTVCPGAVATGLYGLAPRYMKLGIKLGLIITPDRLAFKVINKMFKKKAEYIPGGFVNRFFIFIVESLPPPLVRRIKKMLDKHFML